MKNEKKEQSLRNKLSDVLKISEKRVKELNAELHKVWDGKENVTEVIKHYTKDLIPSQRERAFILISLGRSIERNEASYRLDGLLVGLMGVATSSKKK